MIGTERNGGSFVSDRGSDFNRAPGPPDSDSRVIYLFLLCPRTMMWC